MHPVLKRILVHGGLTAGVLALVGLMFAELANLWTSAITGPPASANINLQLPESLRYRVPATLAGIGFLFVAVGELIARVFRRNGRSAPVDTKPTESPPDDVEQLLNELLTQAEAKMAAEQKEREIVAGSPETGHAEPALAGTKSEVEPPNPPAV